MDINHLGLFVKQNSSENIGSISLGKTIPLAIIIMMITLSYSVLIPEGSSEVEGIDLQPVWTYDTGNDVRKSSISADGNYIGVESDRQFFLFNKESSTPLWSYTANERIMWFELSDTGEYIAVGTLDSDIMLFSRSSSTPLWTYTAGEVIDSVDISGDGNYIVAGSTNDYVYFFSKSSSTPLWSYDSGYDITNTAISNDGEYIVVGTREAKVILFQRESSTPLWTHKIGNYVLDVDISTDGESIVAGNKDSTIFLFNKDNSTPVWSYQSGGDMTVEISEDGGYIIAPSADKNTYFFSVNSSTPIWNHTANDKVNWAAISEDGEYSVSGSKDNTVSYFRKDSSKPLWTYSTGDEVWGQLGISGDGAYIAVSSNDDNFYLFQRIKLMLSPSASQYRPADTVFIDTSLHNGSANITFQVKDPDGINYSVETYQTNDSGFLNFKFRLRENVKGGTWSVIATNDRDNSTDTITFLVDAFTPPQLIIKALDLPTSITHGQSLKVNFTIENTFPDSKDTTFILQLKDDEYTPLEPIIEVKTISESSTSIHSLSIAIPSDAALGQYFVQGQILTELPENAGYAIDYFNTGIEVL